MEQMHFLWQCLRVLLVLDLSCCLWFYIIVYQVWSVRLRLRHMYLLYLFYIILWEQSLHFRNCSFSSWGWYGCWLQYSYIWANSWCFIQWKKCSYGFYEEVLIIYYDFDAQVTTFISALILFEFGKGSVKGFATMLMVSTITTYC